MNYPRFDKVWHYVVIFVLLESFIVGLMTLNKNKQAQKHYDITGGELATNYQAVFDQYQKLSESIVASVISEPRNIKLLNDALTNENSRGQARQKLQDELSPLYLKLKQLGVKQFQFHLSDNTSLLRLHEPKLFGDSLGDFRATVRLANETKQPVFGFESGRAASGFRYVFPVFDDDRQLGSVEIGIDFNAFASSLSKLSHGEYMLLTKKDHLEKVKLFTPTNRFLEFEPCKNYLIETNQVETPKIFTQIAGLMSTKIAKNCDGVSRFCMSASVPQGQKTVAFLPIKDVLGVNAAYVVEVKEDDMISFFNAMFARTFIIVTFFIAVLLFMIYLVNKKRQSIWQLNLSLQGKQEELQTILDASGGPLAIIKDTGEFLYTNYSYQKMLGYTASELGSMNCFELGLESEKELSQRAIAEALEGGYSALKKSCHAKDGHIIVSSVQLTKMPDEHSIIVAAHDITKESAYTCSLEHSAYTDLLTGIPNRRYLEIKLDEAVSFCHMTNKLFALVVMDIDYFKKINDTYGHAIGDFVLKKFADVVFDSIRSNDIIGRWGGEEFLLILRDSDENQSMAVAQKIRKLIESEQFEQAGSITCSFGVSMYRNDEKWQTLFDRADEALYRAKHNGRNCVEII